MIDIYTERKDSKDWIFYNDLYFNLNTGNEDMPQKEIDLIQQVEEAKLTPDKHIGINETYIITKIADFERCKHFKRQYMLCQR